MIPVEWKKAKVTPLHKPGAKDNPQNYYPISVLSVVSKVFERLIHKQLASVFDEMACYVCHNLVLEENTQLRQLSTSLLMKFLLT